MKSVKLVVCRIEKEGKLLMLHRIDKNHWELPGGKVEEGETFEEAGIREVKEELGCEIKVIKFFGNSEYKTPKKIYKSKHYAAEIIQGKPEIKEPRLFDEIKYIDLDEEVKLSPNIIR